MDKVTLALVGRFEVTKESLNLARHLVQVAKELTIMARRKVTPLLEKAVAVAALEIWLAQQHSTNRGRFTNGAIPFIRRLIAENRELFDELAQR